MDARRAGHDRHRYQYHADKAAKNTHGRDKGKRDARSSGGNQHIARPRRRDGITLLLDWFKSVAERTG
jgi:hypothetical protein